MEIALNVNPASCKTRHFDRISHHFGMKIFEFFNFSAKLIFFCFFLLFTLIQIIRYDFEGGWPRLACLFEIGPMWKFRCKYFSTKNWIIIAHKHISSASKFLHCIFEWRHVRVSSSKPFRPQSAKWISVKFKQTLLLNEWKSNCLKLKWLFPLRESIYLMWFHEKSINRVQD